MDSISVTMDVTIHSSRVTIHFMFDHCLDIKSDYSLLKNEVS